jgi:hypothetical protein
MLYVDGHEDVPSSSAAAAAAALEKFIFCRAFIIMPTVVSD